MLKKAHKSVQDLSEEHKNSTHYCSVCCSTKTVFYVCDSGHTICNKCQYSDGSECPQDSGDFVLEKKATKNHKKLKKSRTLTFSHGKDLASGDHDKRSKTNHIKRKTKSDCKIKINKDNLTCGKLREEKEEIETVVEYKNANFLNNKSSSSSVESMPANLKSFVEVPDNHVFPRPVVCPVQDCNKMIALDSIMLHFYFDHSKVPRMTLGSVPKEVLIKPSSLSTETNCLGVFLLRHKESAQSVEPRGPVAGTQSDAKSVLLMGAKIQINKLAKPINDEIVTCNVTTQTKLADRENSTNNASATKMLNGDHYKSIAEDTFDGNEILLLWICKLDDCTETFTITLRNGKNRSHSFTGEAVHVRDDQSSMQMYQQADCLVLNGAAANKLLDETKQLTVLIQVLE